LVASVSLYRYATPRARRSFPTRRSSDLVAVSALPLIAGEVGLGAGALGDGLTALDLTAAEAEGSGMAWTRLGLWELAGQGFALRSEEHTSELQSREKLVCRLLLEKKKTR